MIRKKIVLIIYILVYLICLPLRIQAVVADFPNTTIAWPVPAGVTQLTVHVWGAGGGGGAAQLNGLPGKAGGGGGGAYAREVFIVNDTQTYDITIGNGGLAGTGAGGNGGNGQSSSFTGPGGNVAADGGAGGGGSIGGVAGFGGAGGGGGTGDVNYAGGNGAPGGATAGGGGGGAGTYGPGGSTLTSIGGAGAALWGGNGADGPVAEALGVAGSLRGGGGSGAFGGTGPDLDGGVGAKGHVRIVYDLASIGIAKDSDLDFGSFIPGGAGDTVVIDADSVGNRSKTGGAILVGVNGGSAEFTISGGVAMQFMADLLVNPTALTFGANTIQVALTIGYDNQADASIGKVYVGGIITFDGFVKPPGSYDANATISVSYE